MGLDVSATMIYGLPAQKFKKLIKTWAEQRDQDADLQEWAEDLYLDIANSSDGVEEDEWLIGITIYTVGWEDAPLELKCMATPIAKAILKFKELTGMDGKLYLSCYTW